MLIAPLCVLSQGIKPMWEDAANAAGGKWVLNLRNQEKHLLPQFWETLVLGLIGETIDADDEITGAAVCSRGCVRGVRCMAVEYLEIT